MGMCFIFICEILNFFDFRDTTTKKVQMFADLARPHIRSATVVFESEVSDGMCLSSFDMLNSRFIE